ncbi:MAG: NAD(P)H-hydrate dehydratase [Acinetobacter sp.]
MQQVYCSQQIRAWEQRWFAQGNSALGLMQQVAWLMTQHIHSVLKNSQSRIAVWCGHGNNAGDGFYVAHYLYQYGYQVDIFKISDPVSMQSSPSLSNLASQAQQICEQSQIAIFSELTTIGLYHYDCYIDALFGLGLDRNLNDFWQQVIQKFNQQAGFKISLDIPSGLHPDTGCPLPVAIQADLTLSVLGLKAGLFTGRGKQFSGKVHLISAIPTDEKLVSVAQLSPRDVVLPKRQAFGHKGNYGHVLIVGGHANMGGAAIMAGEAALATGAAKVTLICDVRHHSAALARSPNMMLRDLNQLTAQDISQLLQQADVVALGMGLGRDDWAQRIYELWMEEILKAADIHVVLDADALWFLSQTSQRFSQNIYLTPHSGEAARLLGISTQEIEADRMAAIHHLQHQYGGEWVLKGAGSLILQNKLWICTQGNAGMATGGMGDVLSGMIAGLKAQFNEQIQLHQIVALHAQAGDILAKHGMRGIQAQHMPDAIYQLMNTEDVQT